MNLKKLFKMTGLFLLAVTLWSQVACTSEEPRQVIECQTNIENDNAVHINEALSRANDMYNSLFKTTRSERGISNIQYVPFGYRSTRSSEQMGFYVVNYDNDEGFAILSADKRGIPVYAISNKGCLNLNDTATNNGLSWYINEALPELAAANINYSPKDSISEIYHPIVIPWEQKTEFSSPLLTGFLSKFHQYSPYNKYMENPFIPTGFVPLAVGTVFGYYEWPFAIESYILNWDEMKSNERDTMWARLFEVLGRPSYLDVNYGIQESGVIRNNLDKSLKRTFINCGYSTPSFAKFDLNTVRTELEANRLVIVNGVHSENNFGHKGHAWIVDGGYSYCTQNIPTYPDEEPSYTYLNYLHCVWGFGGEGNGYYFYGGYLGGACQEYDPGCGDYIPQYQDLRIAYGLKPNR